MRELRSNVKATRVKGITVVELLVVMAILGIVMSVLVAFFSQQSRLTSQTQARNEVEVKLRSVAEVIAQDLLMTGSRIVNVNGQVRNVQLADYCTVKAEDDDPCVTTGADPLLTVYYASSLRSDAPYSVELEDEDGETYTAFVDPACRQVGYALNEEGTLLRSDQPCALDSGFVDFADNITALEISFECADGALAGDPLACYASGSFPIQASIDVTGLSDNPREAITTSVTLTATMPNLRPPPPSE